MEIKPTKVTTTLSNLKTKEKYKTEEEWKAKGIPFFLIRQPEPLAMELTSRLVILTSKKRLPYNGN